MDARRGVAARRFISPLLSNIYLNPLDHLMAQQGFEMVRYADDFVILCRSPEEAANALALVQQWTAEAGLKLHPEKTKIVHTQTDVLDFLGYRFQRGRRYPRPKSLQTQGRDPREDETDLWGELDEDHQRPDSTAARLV